MMPVPHEPPPGVWLGSDSLGPERPLAGSSIHPEVVAVKRLNNVRDNMSAAQAINQRNVYALAGADPGRVGSAVSRESSRLRVRRLTEIADCTNQRSAPAGLFRTDQPEGRVLGEPLGVVEVFVTSQATIDRLPQQAGRK